jgi:hypothetical protein
LKTTNFFSTQIYVRNNVRKIFGLYLNDVGMVKPQDRPTVLIRGPKGRRVQGSCFAYQKLDEWRCKDSDGGLVDLALFFNVYFAFSASDPPPPSLLRGMPHHRLHQGGQSPQKNGTSCNMLMLVGRGRYIITNTIFITIGEIQMLLLLDGVLCGYE